MNGFSVLEFIPATIGLTKYGPNLFSYNVDETKFAKDSGSICLSSLNLYRFVFSLNVADLGRQLVFNELTESYSTYNV